MKGVSMSKKMNILKSKYVSPYSRKAIFNMPQKHGKQWNTVNFMIIICFNYLIFYLNKSNKY